MIKAEKAIITAGNKDLILVNCEIYPPDVETPYWFVVAGENNVIMTGTVLIQYTSEEKERRSL